MLLTRAKLPVDDAIRDWIDEQIPWLAGELNIADIGAGEIIEPTDEFFPDRWDGTPDAGVAMFKRVCTYTGVDPARVELAYMQAQEGDPPPALIQRDNKVLLPFEVTELRNPTVAVAIMARKLALLKLIDAGVDTGRDDLPLLADLACVMLGLGIFNANAAVPELPR